MRSHTNPRNWKQKLNENRTLIRAAAVILVITLIQMVGQKKWVHY